MRVFYLSAAVGSRTAEAAPPNGPRRAAFVSPDGKRPAPVAPRVASLISEQTHERIARDTFLRQVRAESQ